MFVIFVSRPRGRAVQANVPTRKSLGRFVLATTKERCGHGRLLRDWRSYGKGCAISSKARAAFFSCTSRPPTFQLQYGLLRPSYVLCEVIRDLRDLTRMRASLSQEASRFSSRIQKVLEDANVKLASVATNVLGKSGRAMLEDIISGEDDPEHLAFSRPGSSARKDSPIKTCSRRKDPFPSSLFAPAFGRSDTVCGTRNCVARRTSGGDRSTVTRAVASGCSLGHNTGDRSSGSVGTSSRNR